MNHLPECLKAQEAEAIYDEQWPNHCEKCGGYGTIRWSENQSPLGSGYYWPEQFCEPCDECAAAGRPEAECWCWYGEEYQKEE